MQRDEPIAHQENWPSAIANKQLSYYMQMAHTVKQVPAKKKTPSNLSTRTQKLVPMQTLLR
jgi:hypothetical protein